VQLAHRVTPPRNPAASELIKFGELPITGYWFQVASAK